MEHAIDLKVDPGSPAVSSLFVTFCNFLLPRHSLEEVLRTSVSFLTTQDKWPAQNSIIFPAGYFEVPPELMTAKLDSIADRYANDRARCNA